MNIEEKEVVMELAAKSKAAIGGAGHVDLLILRTLLDIRDLLSAKSKSRSLLLKEVNMTDRERELLNSLDEEI